MGSETTPEMLAMAIDPALWSEDEQTAHMAASPLTVDSVRRISLENAGQILERLAALRNGEHYHDR